MGREPLVPGVPHGMVRQLVRVRIVGVTSTLAYALQYLALHPILGGQAANLTALLPTAIGNAAAIRCTACWCSRWEKGFEPGLEPLHDVPGPRAANVGPTGIST